MSYQIGENFRNELNKIVGHLPDSNNLNNHLAIKVAQLVIRFMGNENFQSIRFISDFEMSVIKLSVRMCLLPIDVSGHLSQKGLYDAHVYGESSEKDLYGTLYLEVIK